MPGDRGTIQYFTGLRGRSGNRHRILSISTILTRKRQLRIWQDRHYEPVQALSVNLLREMFSTVEDAGVRWLEPASKSIISNKSVVAVKLWEMPRTIRIRAARVFRRRQHPQMG
ncbi:hypothetical protein KCP78_15505 [Salmonella enterica subsp. enterica]|nr:hypothetical protein KCP78_15505 [Salmonella enterica subsp. enterica]